MEAATLTVRASLSLSLGKVLVRPFVVAKQEEPLVQAELPQVLSFLFFEQARPRVHHGAMKDSALRVLCLFWDSF